MKKQQQKTPQTMFMSIIKIKTNAVDMWTEQNYISTFSFSKYTFT